MQRQRFCYHAEYNGKFIVESASLHSLHASVTGSVFLRGYSHYFRDSVDVYILYLLQGAHFLILKISNFVDLPIMKKCSLVKN